MELYDFVVGMTDFYLGAAAEKLGGAILANLVWAKLARGGDIVYEGRVGGKSVDFVQTAGGKPTYWQVAADDEEKARKIRILAAIRDQYPKTVIVAKEQPAEDAKGIKILSAADFFRQENEDFM